LYRSGKIISLLLALLLALCLSATMVMADEVADDIQMELTAEQTMAIELTKENTLAEIEALADSTKNPWVKEILAHATLGEATAGEPNNRGVISVLVTVEFPLLVSGVDAKTVFDGSDPEAFVRAALENALEGKGEYVLNATVAFAEDKEPVFKWHSSKGFKGFSTALNTRARAASTSFSGRPMVAALSAYVFQHPVRGAKLVLTDGPRAMTLSAAGPGYTRMLRHATRTALPRVAYEAEGPNTEADTIASLFNEQIADFGNTFTKAATKKADDDQALSLTFDPWGLIEGASDESVASVREHHAHYGERYTESLDSFFSTVSQLPDLPALEMPKTEQLVGERRGVKIVIIAKKGEGNRSLSFTNLENGELKALCFIRDGERLTIYLPAGDYEIETGSGDIWYGEEVRFGPNMLPIALYYPDYFRVTSLKEGQYWRWEITTPDLFYDIDPEILQYLLDLDL